MLQGVAIKFEVNICMMSFDFNYKFWVATKTDLEHLIRRQNVLKKREPIEDPLITFKILSEIYVLYVDLVNKLGYLYQNTIQVQKRDVIRNLVEPVTRRLIDLKNELKNIEFNEYVYLDKALIARKLTPCDLVIWRSPNFLYRRPPEIQNILYENQLFMGDIEKEQIIEEKNKMLSDFITRIQAHERARQARVYKSNVKYDKKNFKIRMQKRVLYTFTHKKDQIMSMPVKRTVFSANFIKHNECCRDLLKGDNLDTSPINAAEFQMENEELEKAALTIQTAWRKYKAKKIFTKNKTIKQFLYGMRKKRRLINPGANTKSVIEMYQTEMQKIKLDNDYIQLMTNERTRLLQERTPWIMEDISDHIRAWFREFYDKAGDFHPYPDALKSGTVLVLTDESMDLEEFKEYQKLQTMSKEERKNRAEKIKLQKMKEKEKIKKQKLKDAKRRNKLKNAGIYDIGDEIQNNKDVERMEKTLSQYSIDWRNVDEYLNKDSEAIKEWITEGELSTIHKELRILVDEYMRIEYELLKKAWCTDNKKKYKPTKQKKVKNKKERRKKTVKDQTANRTIESLFHELKDAGIIEKYSNKYFDEFIAEFNFIADNTRDEDHLVTVSPAKADIKMVIQESMLGLGEFKVQKPKSLCIVGPQNNGKKLLCNIIASELDALFMNLSPEKTCKYSDDLKYLIHVVMKVAKAFQPTIIFINEAHRIFWKNIPKEEEHLNPRLLQGSLVKKILKPIKVDDKIMVVGTSDLPWSAKPKFKKAFQKILLIPRSDYGTTFLLWLDLISQNVGDTFEDYIISVLAKVFRTYNTGDIIDSVAKTLNVERRMRLNINSLDPNEFLDYFISGSVPTFPIDDKLIEKYEKWFDKSNIYAKLKLKKLLKKNTKKK